MLPLSCSIIKISRFTIPFQTFPCVHIIYSRQGYLTMHVLVGQSIIIEDLWFRDIVEVVNNLWDLYSGQRSVIDLSCRDLWLVNSALQVVTMDYIYIQVIYWTGHSYCYWFSAWFFNFVLNGYFYWLIFLSFTDFW